MLPKYLLAMLVLWLATSCAQGAPTTVLGYLPDYRVASVSDAQLAQTTDVCLFSALPSADGGVQLGALTPAVLRSCRVRTRRAGVHLLLTVGGWGRSAGFHGAADTLQHRHAFVQALLGLCRTYGLDGIDLDWEDPNSEAILPHYGELLSAAAAAFRPRHLLLTAALGSSQPLPQGAAAALDWVGLMAYDHDGRHSTLFDAMADIQRVIRAGMPRQKILLGIPFYARGVHNFDREATYADIVAQSHPAAGTDQVGDLYFNGPMTVEAKVRYAHAQQLRGVMVWELGQDAPGAASLLTVIHRTVAEYSVPRGAGSRHAQHR